MKVLTYSDSNYKKEAQIHLKLAEKYNYKNINKTREHLICTDFYKNNQKILDCERGGGYWLWKPYFILNEVLLLNENEYLIYIDSGDIFSNNIKNYLDHKMIDNDLILMSSFSSNHIYTKRDCFILMDCDTEKYWYNNQIEAGVSIWKKTAFTIKVLNEWLEYCSNWNIISDDNKNQNLNGFIDHRHDQSILTNLCIKYNLFHTHEIRHYIECNYKYYSFNPNSFDNSRELNNFLFQNKHIIYES